MALLSYPSYISVFEEEGWRRNRNFSQFCSCESLTFQQLSTPSDFLRLNLKEFREENRVEHLVPNQSPELIEFYGNRLFPSDWYWIICEVPIEAYWSLLKLKAFAASNSSTLVLGCPCLRQNLFRPSQRWYNWTLHVRQKNCDNVSELARKLNADPECALTAFGHLAALSLPSVAKSRVSG